MASLVTMSTRRISFGIDSILQRDQYPLPFSQSPGCSSKQADGYLPMNAEAALVGPCTISAETADDSFAVLPWQTMSMQLVFSARQAAGWTLPMTSPTATSDRSSMSSFVEVSNGPSSPCTSLTGCLDRGRGRRGLDVDTGNEFARQLLQMRSVSDSHDPLELAFADYDCRQHSWLPSVDELMVNEPRFSSVSCGYSEPGQSTVSDDLANSKFSSIKYV